jgi:hypothetical protein
LPEINRENENMVRSVLSVIAGAIVWMAGFFVLVSLVAVLWPDYVVHGRLWTQQGVFTFTPLMACFNLLSWALAGIAAGWVAMKIAKRREAVWVLAGLIEIYVVALHVVLNWATFPWWYNLGVVIPAIPAILLGARLARTSPAANATAVPG